MAGVNVIDYSTLSINTTVTALSDATPSMPDGAKGALVTLEQANLRMRTDGTDPTTSEGHLVYVGDVLTFDSWTVPKQNWRSTFRTCEFIQAVAATTGLLKITWYD